VYDLANSDASTNGLAGARVVGQDVNGAPVSAASVSAADGTYQFAVHAPRNPDGTPASGTVTLRVDRAGYATFPSGLRTALPIALTSATRGASGWTVKSALTDVGLARIPGAPAGEIVGTVVDLPATGALVVAECGNGTSYSAAPGSSGTYAMFNVADTDPSGPCTVSAYAQGVNYVPVGVTVHAAASNPVTANLARSATGTATVTGSLRFVSKTDFPFTNVLLLVDSTYVSSIERGLAPPGLAATPVYNAGPWTISGIPDGRYRVLSASATDYIVRDPSPIGGAFIPILQVVGGVPSPASIPPFDVTGAVELTGPFPDANGACTTLSSLPADPSTLPSEPCVSASPSPTFAWKAFSATDHYVLKVIDDLGNPVWQADVDKSCNVGGLCTIDYGTSPAFVTATPVTAQTLSSGSTYQVRLVAINVGGGRISSSEDLLGVFTKE
jgi:hypothetical protein